MQIITPESINKPDTYIVGGKEWEVEGYIKADNSAPNSQFIPLVNIPFMSDYKWQLNCLKDRLKNPEKYEAFENVPATIERLKKWLAEHIPQETEPLSV